MALAPRAELPPNLPRSTVVAAARGCQPLAPASRPHCRTLIPAHQLAEPQDYSRSTACRAAYPRALPRFASADAKLRPWRRSIAAQVPPETAGASARQGGIEHTGSSASPMRSTRAAAGLGSTAVKVAAIRSNVAAGSRGWSCRGPAHTPCQAHSGRLAEGTPVARTPLRCCRKRLHRPLLNKKTARAWLF
jgi:hypothetical protein